MKNKQPLSMNKHPLSSFQYCPRCGTDNFLENNEKSKRCAACGFVYYYNSSIAVVAVIENEKGEILVAHRAKEPAKGTLDLPGGFVDMYESAEEALRREIMEETSLTVTAEKYLFSIPNIYRYSAFEVQTVDLFFKCEVSDFNGLKADDDVMKLEFIAPDGLNPSAFGLISIRKGIEKYLQIV